MRNKDTSKKQEREKLEKGNMNPSPTSLEAKEQEKKKLFANFIN